MFEKIKRGFTLIELAITGGILAVLVATVVGVAVSQAGDANAQVDAGIAQMTAYENVSVLTYIPDSSFLNN